MLSREALKDLALGLLELSKKFLKEDRCLDPMAFVVIEGDHFPRPLDFHDEGRKMASCKRVLEEARAKNAIAIITIFTARSKEFAGKVFDENVYSWGKLQSEGRPRCILLTVSGPNIHGWALEVPFEEEDDAVVLGEAKEYDPEEVILGLFPGWPRGNAD